MNKINSIAIAGGGTAGFVAALILKTRFSKIKIDIIRSSKIGIVGVGEGSTEHWNEFLKFIGIDVYTLIKETDATCKLGIMFEGWADKPYFHSVQNEFIQLISQYPYLLGKLIGDCAASSDISLKCYWENKVDTWFVDKPTECPSIQYHFNTRKLNEFLTNKARSLGIGIIDDEILDVTLNDNGEIDSVIGEYNKYNYDFYIDSTGFKRILISKLGAKWQSYGKFLKANAAIAFQTADTANYNIWTLAKAMDSGWLFRLPVWGRWGNGYIFNSDYISDEQAKLEVEKYFGHNIEINKTFRFDPGALDKVWIKNCCAIGLSASFVEPMEASSIGTSIQQSFLLMHRLSNYDELTIKKYNHSVNTILDNIRDFVALHYMTKKQDTNFWKDVSSMPIPDSLSERLEIWQHKLPIGEDFNSQSDYSLFKENNFTMVLHGLGLFNTASVKKEYDALESSLHSHANKLLANIRHYENTMQAITHKEYIKKIRES